MARGATGHGRWGAVAASAVLVAVVAACTVPAPRGRFAVPDAPCTDVTLVTARGSSDPVRGRVVRQMSQDLAAALTTLDPSTTLRSLELGDLDGDGRVDPGGYPAVGALGTPGIDTTADPDLDPALLGGYNDSRRIGSEELAAVLVTLAARCAGTRFVLSGYSMGGDAIGAGLGSLPDDVAARVVTVELFGDPRFVVGPWMRAPGAEFPSGHGLLGARTPYVPASLSSRTSSWCGEVDGVCTGQLPYLLLQLLTVCAQYRELPACSRRHVDYGLWAIPAAMAESAALVSSAP